MKCPRFPHTASIPFVCDLVFQNTKTQSVHNSHKTRSMETLAMQSLLEITRHRLWTAHVSPSSSQKLTQATHARRESLNVLIIYPF